jgi:hypothetical protein
MINSNIARPDPLAAIIVFGKPGGPDLPQACWFKAEDIAAVKAAAGPLKFSVIELRTDADKALAIGVHEGVLKGSGRIIIGSVTPEVYRRIEEYARKAAGADPTSASKSDEKALGGAKASADINVSQAAADAASAPPASSVPTETEPKTAARGAPVASQASPVEPPSPTAPWESLRVGGTVLAAYWNTKKELEGFWPALIARVDKNEVVLQWRDTPEFEPGKVERKHIAILHPDFLASGK